MIDLCGLNCRPVGPEEVFARVDPQGRRALAGGTDGRFGPDEKRKATGVTRSQFRSGTVVTSVGTLREHTIRGIHTTGSGRLRLESGAWKLELQ
jgi:hypothetical protein